MREGFWNGMAGTCDMTESGAVGVGGSAAKPAGANCGNATTSHTVAPPARSKFIINKMIKAKIKTLGINKRHFLADRWGLSVLSPVPTLCIFSVIPLTAIDRAPRAARAAATRSRRTYAQCVKVQRLILILISYCVLFGNPGRSSRYFLYSLHFRIFEFEPSNYNPPLPVLHIFKN